MPRQAELFEAAGGSVVEGYLRLKRRGGNIPPAWIERAHASRANLHEEVARALRKGGRGARPILRDWEVKYRKECFYRGLRALLELERQGRTRR